MLHFEQAGENLTRRYKRQETILQIQRIKELRQQGRTIPEIKLILSQPEK